MNMTEIFTRKFENSLVKLIGGNIRRILYDRSELYYGSPCILMAESKLVLELKIEDKYYDLIINGVNLKNAHDNIKLTRFWSGLFGYRLFSSRNYLNTFTFLESPSYSCNYDLKISSIELYVSNYSEDTSIFGYILIYLEPELIFQIRRHHDDRYIELTISKSDNYSKSSIEEDYKLFKII